MTNLSIREPINAYLAPKVVPHNKAVLEITDKPCLINILTIKEDVNWIITKIAKIFALYVFQIPARVWNFTSNLYTETRVFLTTTPAEKAEKKRMEKLAKEALAKKNEMDAKKSLENAAGISSKPPAMDRGSSGSSDSSSADSSTEGHTSDGAVLVRQRKTVPATATAEARAGSSPEEVSPQGSTTSSPTKPPAANTSAAVPPTGLAASSAASSASVLAKLAAIPVAPGIDPKHAKAVTHGPDGSLIPSDGHLLVSPDPVAHMLKPYVPMSNPVGAVHHVTAETLGTSAEVSATVEQGSVGSLSSSSASSSVSLTSTTATVESTDEKPAAAKK